MKTLRITGVPEHFNYPFRLLFEEQPFLKKGIRIEWKEESRGSGQMNLDLRNDDTDLAILLTESFLKDFEAGNPSKIIGFHVTSPLIWGIHAGKNSSIYSLSDLKEKKILVSRMGSGSHLMALALAKQEVWHPEELSFEIVGNMEGAEKVMNEGSEGIFLWEKYTTAPKVAQGVMRRIGEIPSPWPCFVLVASEKALAEFGEILIEVRDEIYRISEKLTSKEHLPELLANEYTLNPIDVGDWLGQTVWCTQSSVSKRVMERSIQKMIELNILRGNLDLASFLEMRNLRLEA
jgi:ABC-type nitrate/sulfonate/bicarbonate transport system substrate-binding protein